MAGDLDQLKAMLDVLAAEVDAYRHARLRMPNVRRNEIGSALAPIVSDAQRWWSELPIEARAGIRDARVRLLAAKALSRW